MKHTKLRRKDKKAKKTMKRLRDTKYKEITAMHRKEDKEQTEEVKHLCIINSGECLYKGQRRAKRLLMTHNAASPAPTPAGGSATSPPSAMGRPSPTPPRTPPGLLSAWSTKRIWRTRHRRQRPRSFKVQGPPEEPKDDGSKAEATKARARAPPRAMATWPAAGGGSIQAAMELSSDGSWFQQNLQ